MVNRKCVRFRTRPSVQLRCVARAGWVIQEESFFISLVWDCAWVVHESLRIAVSMGGSEEFRANAGVILGSFWD